MDTTKFSVSGKDIAVYSGDLLVICMVQPEQGLPSCDERLRPLVINALELGDFKGKMEETLVLYPDPAMAIAFSARRIMLAGMGKIATSADPGDLKETCRIVGGNIARHCARIQAGSIMISLPTLFPLEPGGVAESLAEGVVLGDYRFRKYKTEDKNEQPYPGLKKVVFHTSSRTGEVRKGVERGERAARAANAARDMANEPGSGWTPSRFGEYAQGLADRMAMQVTILEKEDMQRLGMGGILAVSRGSAEPPKMVILQYRPDQPAETILLVGKGLTFDSGGVSLKPATGMQDMKYDMCGGAAVLSAMQVIGEERPDVGVVAIIPATENMGGGAAVKPGDIIAHYGGVTSEIVNTDAEGRLILADALAYGIEKFSPCCVIDLATLTGAVIIALGHHYTGILGNNDELTERVREAGRCSGEPMWRLPLGPEYSKQIESEVADIKNTGGKPAGTITAAAYLQKFVQDVPWVHLDIAGTAWEFTEKSYIPKGPSGIGTRSLIELIRNWSAFSPEK
ncbi:leucyl aminopeptidase [Desulfoprunum benzoelyticum]|uniref:Probable cytosol aminopeptidase n=1 Tax=Desulfoprunum benzoelyticum TaxID=1506996 RepID=A0A840UNL0_9BACT|nr:leucyl aminopeptidase [Desulfoprunum benzoelyticum]MBB5346416.1 leucyl aminopeptidase [Desulfoprunum benzoelyticum]MBM9528585.1 leucyl aminopeptidase [Desulfoprunum benzoelyticum]